MAEKSKGFQKGKSGNPAGRPAGVPNKINMLLKDAIIQAAQAAGGPGGIVGYLTLQATENPSAFMALLGKVLPKEHTGEDGGPIKSSITVTFR